MSSTFARMFSLFTLLSYLVVGTVTVRIFYSENTSISVSRQYLSMFGETEFKADEYAQIEIPLQYFPEIEFPSEKIVPTVKKAARIAEVKPAPVAIHKEMKKVTKTDLPFHEPVTLSPVEFDGSLPSLLVALYVPAPKDVVEMVAGTTEKEIVTDEIATKQAKSEVAVSEKVGVDEDPTFFEYPIEEKVVEATAADTQVSKPVQDETVEKIVDNSQSSVEEVAIDDLLAFDYSAAQKDIKTQSAPVVSKVTTQVVAALPGVAAPIQQESAVSTQNLKPSVPRVIAKNQTMTTQTDPLKAPVANTKTKGLMSETPDRGRGYPSEVTIQVTGTSLKKNQPVSGFELRFQDDQGQSLEDYGSGEVSLKENLAEAAMTRSVVLLKRGFTPTNTDLILEKGLHGISLPLIEEDVFNEMIAPFEARGSVGGVLVELDDETERVSLDIPYGKVIHLDGDMKKTKEKDFRYQLFIGVKAGNALLSYKDARGQVVSKIIHVHERELTFEANYYEQVIHETIALRGEDLLSKKKSPLIIAASDVKPFATDKDSRKINDHTHKLDFGRGLLAGRSYIELTHLDEPVFVGIRTNNKVSVPSENLMRHLLSKMENGKLGNRCLIQVNLARKVDLVEVGTESVAESLRAIPQYLDTDGKFYDSTSESTVKVIVVGENQGPIENGQDGKVNMKITYQDGTTQFLSSYCSPNTYLVEQL